METRSINGLDRLREQGHAKDAGQRRAALKQVAEEFEAVFMYQVVQAMRQTVPKSGLVEKGEGEEVFEGMLDEEWAKKLAGRGGPASLSEVLYRQLSRAAGLEEEGGARAVQAPSAAPVPKAETRLPAPGAAEAGKTKL
ncbi:MAG: rod-binding protein [Candidatus Latescibacteria bacterium]|nr:rod-binding protein [Candidatus Latescibacterota bacterium]